MLYTRSSSSDERIGSLDLEERDEEGFFHRLMVRRMISNTRSPRERGGKRRRVRMKREQDLDLIVLTIVENQAKGSERISRRRNNVRRIMKAGMKFSISRK